MKLMYRITIIMFIVLFFAACDNSVSVDNTPSELTTSEQYRQMVLIGGMTIMGSETDGAFPSGRTVNLSAFQIAKYETTYQLWYEVKNWSTSHGYTYDNQGREGSDGSDGAIPSTDKTKPVTVVSWGDAVVWCNAYSEREGKTPVYYSGLDNTVLKNATSTSTINGATMKSGATGYRLPTEAEWEAAARGGSPSNATEWGYIYAGSNTASNVAWHSGSGTHTVGGKAANGVGLYDMSGNVWEWCFDWYSTSINTGEVTDPVGATSGTHRVHRSGDWYRDESYCVVSYRASQTPHISGNQGNGLGFRVVCAP